MIVSLLMVLLVPLYLLQINKYSVENSKRKNIKLTLNQVVQNYLTLFSN